MPTLTTILQNEIRALEAKIQFLVDNWPADLEDGCITFPDGKRWDTTATANAYQDEIDTYYCEICELSFDADTPCQCY